MREAYICAYVRTPIGRYAGGLAPVRADDLGAVPLKALQERNPGVDWEAVEEIAWSDVPVGPHVIALLSHPGWFEAADELHRWEAWLNDPARLDAAMNQLVPAARHHGDRIADLIRPHIGESEQWRLWLRALVSWSLTPELVPLAVELIEGGHIDDARGPIAVNSDFWSIVHTLLTKDPVGATRVTGSFLRRGLEVAQAEGSGDPFESGHL